MQTNPILYIIAGCNGAGKTTASFTLLPKILDCREFVNADEIARGISPFQPESVSFEAARIMLHRIDELLNAHDSFAIETTLATLIYQKKIEIAKQRGYQIKIVFYFLATPEMAIDRVRQRVLSGGHNIPKNVIQRRFIGGITNLFQKYIYLCDECFIFNNSSGYPELIAEKTKASTDLIIYDDEIVSKMKIYI